MTAVELLKKHGIKPNKSSKAKVAIEERVTEIVKEAVAKKESKGPSRNDLMLKAKVAGIKNFRILNKEELQKVLDPMTTGHNQDEIVKVAVVRWKSGWGTKKVANA